MLLLIGQTVSSTYYLIHFDLICLIWEEINKLHSVEYIPPAKILPGN